MTDLNKYTNNEKRRAFFDDRSEEEGWYLWLEESRLNRKYMRCDIDDTSFIAELREQTIPYPKHHVTFRIKAWYMVKDWNKPFEDNLTNMSAMIEELKKLQKGVKQKEKTA